jgi:hypothetical protein
MAFRTSRGVLTAAVLVLMTQIFAVSCRTIKPYEKEYLLHPTMDDARVDRLSAPYGKSLRPNERLAVAAGGGSSYACPTCGGK